MRHSAKDDTHNTLGIVRAITVRCESLTDNEGGVAEDQTERQAYLEERKLLIDAEREASRSFDQAMITLSAGALGLSVTFIEKLAPAPAVSQWLLYSAWSCFTVALLAILSSFLCSQFAMRRQRDINDANYERETSEDSVSGELNSEERNRWATVTNILNWSSIVCFILGVAFLLIFSIVNLPNKFAKAEEENRVQQQGHSQQR